MPIQLRPRLQPLHPDGLADERLVLHAKREAPCVQPRNLPLVLIIVASQPRTDGHVDVTVPIFARLGIEVHDSPKASTGSEVHGASSGQQRITQRPVLRVLALIGLEHDDELHMLPVKPQLEPPTHHVDFFQ